MERWQEQGRGPGDVPLETVRTWRLWQTEGERRIGARFARRAVRGRPGPLSGADSARWSGKTAGSSPQSTARPPRRESSLCWDER